jgi:hypothetical protein
MFRIRPILQQNVRKVFVKFNNNIIKKRYLSDKIEVQEKKLDFFVVQEPNIPKNLLGDPLRTSQILINLRLTINTGNYGSSEGSDWALSCVMIWDTELSDSEMLELIF